MFKGRRRKVGEPKHRNIFTKKYRCCRGSSDKAKDMRAFV